VAASNSYVPNFYADELEARASNRKAFYSESVRSLASIAHPASGLLAAAACVFLVYTLVSATALPLTQRAVGSLVVGIVAALSTQSRRQNVICNLIQIRESETVLRSAVCAQIAFICVNVLLGKHLPLWAYLLSTLATIAATLVMRAMIALLLRQAHHAGFGANSVVIYGHSETTKQIANALLRSPLCGFHPVAMIHDDSLRPAERTFRLGGDLCKSVTVAGAPLTSTKLMSLHCNLLIFAATQLSQGERTTAANIARECGSAVALLSPVTDSEESFELIEVDGLHLVTQTRAVSSRHSLLLKRAVDIVVALVLILLGSPVLLLIALCIKLDSPGPVLFTQKRVGRNGELFTIFKFRSMHVGSARYEASPTEPTDPRITRVGRMLRRAGLDETAQLFNVLLGQMSLVGPRPEMPFLVDRHIRQHSPRLQCVPGITGLWQLSNDRAFPIHQHTHYDLFYIRNRTLCMDIAILLHTLFFAMRGGV